VQWNRTYGGQNDDRAYSMLQTADGGYALAGSTNSFGVQSNDAWLVKTDDEGNMQWDKTYGGQSDESARSLIKTADGGYVMAGQSINSVTKGWLIKTDAFGSMEYPDIGLTLVDGTADTLMLYRGSNDPYWNYVRVEIFAQKENP
jgi:hypothetical protein